LAVVVAHQVGLVVLELVVVLVLVVIVVQLQANHLVVAHLLRVR
jgi:hypothetical protein